MFTAMCRRTSLLKTSDPSLKSKTKPQPIICKKLRYEKIKPVELFGSRFSFRRSRGACCERRWKLDLDDSRAQRRAGTSIRPFTQSGRRHAYRKNFFARTRWETNGHSD